MVYYMNVAEGTRAPARENITMAQSNGATKKVKGPKPRTLDISINNGSSKVTILVGKTQALTLTIPEAEVPAFVWAQAQLPGATIVKVSR